MLWSAMPTLLVINSKHISENYLIDLFLSIYLKFIEKFFLDLGKWVDFINYLCVADKLYFFD